MKRPTPAPPSFRCGECGKNCPSAFALKQHRAFTGHGHAPAPCAPITFGMDQNRCNTCGIIWDRGDEKPKCPKL